MKVYKNTTVYEESKKRIRTIFEEFDNVIVGASGGKDSTTVLELTLEVAKEMNRLPINVLWLDQEAEWNETYNYMKEVFNREEVIPYWMQIPFRLFNSASFNTDWLKVWDEEEEDKWIRPKEDIAYKENVYGSDRFAALFPAIADYHFPEGYAYIAGVRAQESLARYVCTTTTAKYKDITWAAKSGNKGIGYRFYPIYDWSAEDIWSVIAKKGWKYNKMYDKFYQYGVPFSDMRISNLHHETAYRSLFILQELDRDLYNKLVKRLPGIDTFGKLQEDVQIYKLPEMFATWAEYRDYLLENLIREDLKVHFEKRFYSKDKDGKLKQGGEKWARYHVNEILANDWTGTKNSNHKIRLKLEKYKDEGRYKYRGLRTNQEELKGNTPKA